MFSKAIIIATIAAVVAAQAPTAELIKATVTFVSVHDHHVRQTVKPCMPGAVNCIQVPMVAGQVGPNTFRNDKRQATAQSQVVITTIPAIPARPTYDQIFEQDQLLSNLPVPTPMASSTRVYSKNMTDELHAAFASDPASQASSLLAIFRHEKAAWESHKSSLEHELGFAKHHIKDLNENIKKQEKRLAYHNAKGSRKNSGTSVQLPVSLLGISLVTAIAFGGLAFVL